MTPIWTRSWSSSGTRDTKSARPTPRGSPHSSTNISICWAGTFFFCRSGSQQVSLGYFGRIERSKNESLSRFSVPLILEPQAGHKESNVAFVSAFLSRNAAFKKAVPDLAWNSFVWFASEPDALVALERDDSSTYLHQRLAASA